MEQDTVVYPNVSVNDEDMIPVIDMYLRKTGRLTNASPWEWHCLASRFKLMGYTKEQFEP